MVEVLLSFIVIYPITGDIVRLSYSNMIVEAIISVYEHGLPKNNNLIKENNTKAFDSTTLTNFINASKVGSIASGVKQWKSQKRIEV